MRPTLNTRTRLILTPIIITLAAGLAFSQTPLRARTESGREVILSPDGTWKYAAEEPHSVAPRSTAGKTLFKAPQGNFGIWYDPAKWSVRQDADSEGRIHFKLKRGDAYALVLIEEIPVPTRNLKGIALANAKEAAPDAKITFEGTTTIDGKDVLILKIEGTVQEIPFRYYGYYFGGQKGTIQVLTFTGQAIFQKYEDEFTEFLNGLVIY